MIKLGSYVFKWSLDPKFKDLNSSCKLLLEKDTLSLLDMIEKCVTIVGEPMIYLEYLLCNQNTSCKFIKFKIINLKLSM